MEEQFDQGACIVCEEPLDGIHQTSCQMCGGTFHQPWSPDSEVPKCGHLASHEDALVIVFLCEDCYQGRRP